jgi:hypothetical protein
MEGSLTNPAMARSSFASRLALPFAVLTMLLGSAGVAAAQPVGQPARNRPTPEQWQKIFPEHRNLALRGHRERIGILQRGERCIRAAGDSTALRNCQREERRAYQEHRRRHKQEMRQLFESRGIPVPEWGRRGRGGGWGGDV